MSYFQIACLSTINQTPDQLSDSQRLYNQRIHTSSLSAAFAPCYIYYVRFTSLYKPIRTCEKYNYVIFIVADLDLPRPHIYHEKRGCITLRNIIEMLMEIIYILPKVLLSGL